MKSINIRGQKQIIVRRLISCIMAVLLLGASIPGGRAIAASGKQELVYLDGSQGNDENHGGQADKAVKTFMKAKELLKAGGTIVISGPVSIYGEETWSLSGLGGIRFLNAEEKSKMTVTSGSPVIRVAKQASLILEAVTITGSSDILIYNSGTVNLKENAILKNGTVAVNEKGIETQPGGITMKNGEIVAQTPAGKKANVLEILCESTVFGQIPNPSIAVNESQGAVSFFYKLQGAGDDTYTETVPTAVGNYVIMAISMETDEYQSAKVYADFSINKANPQDVEFPVAVPLPEGRKLADSQLMHGVGDGTYTWAKPDVIPSAAVKAYEVVFTPRDVQNYDYSQIEDWNSETQTIIRKVSLELIPAKGPEPGPVDEPEKEPAESEAVAETDQFPETAETDKNDPASDQKADGETAAETEDGSADDVKNNDSHPMNADSKVVEAVNALPVEIQTSDMAAKVLEVTRMYERLSQLEKDALPEQTVKALELAQQAAGEINHSSNGVIAAGKNLPWYVQLRATVKAKSDQAEQSQDHNVIIIPYEIKLWNLKDQTEYILGPGEEITLTMPAPDLERYEDIVILHYLEDGEIERIQPAFAGELMSFKTSSFSPFDVAGSIVIVGPSAGNGNTNSNSSNSNSNTSGNNNSNANNSNTTNNNSSNTNKNNSNSGSNTANQGYSAPKTGDNNPIILLVLVLLAAAGTIVFLYATRKRKQ